MKKTTFRALKMDCADEEPLVRMRLERRPGIRTVDIDLQRDVDAILRGLNLGVIVAAGLVRLTLSNVPGPVIGLVVPNLAPSEFSV